MGWCKNQKHKHKNKIKNPLQSVFIFSFHKSTRVILIFCDSRLESMRAANRAFVCIQDKNNIEPRESFSMPDSSEGTISQVLTIQGFTINKVLLEVSHRECLLCVWTMSSAMLSGTHLYSLTTEASLFGGLFDKSFHTWNNEGLRDVYNQVLT